MNNMNKKLVFEENNIKIEKFSKIAHLTPEQNCSIYCYMKYLYNKTLECMVALLVDYTKKGKPRLYCGQIGVIEYIRNYESCLVTFQDHHHEEYKEGDDKVIHTISVSFTDLLPLFFILPNSNYNDHTIATTIGQELQMRKNWYNLVVKQKHETITLFKPHKKSDNEFNVNQLVAVQDNFINQSDSFVSSKVLAIPTVYCGQVGKIVEIFENSYVKVEFNSFYLDELIDPDDDDIPLLRRQDKKSSILEKDYLLPLYAENLSRKKFYYREYMTNCLQNKKPMTTDDLQPIKLRKENGFWLKPIEF